MEQTFEQIVEAYSEAIYHTAYLYLRKRDVAEDIVQEVFTTFFEKQAQFKGAASIKTYLIRMTINRCYDYHRSWKNKAHDWIEYFTVKSNENVEQTYATKESASELLDAISQLKPKLREVIILYYFEELLIREIAEVLQCNENTIQTRLARGKMQLKAVLVKYEGGDWNEKAIVK